LQLPKAWEIVHDLTRLAKDHHLPIASHDDDTALKVAMMAELGVTISEFPVTLEAAQTARVQGMQTLMGAPNALRGRSHSGNLSATEALQASNLDSLASDYYPAAMLNAAFALAKQSIALLHETLKLVSLHPARAVGLADRGCLAVGKQADLVFVQSGPTFSTATVKVIATLREGRIIYWSGQVLPIPSNAMVKAVGLEKTGRGETGRGETDFSLAGLFK
jgi:alpha-D-ribose 1-methylphosphonate 5-triphosphate diphosphatase